MKKRTISLSPLAHAYMCRMEVDTADEHAPGYHHRIAVALMAAKTTRPNGRALSLTIDEVDVKHFVASLENAIDCACSSEFWPTVKALRTVLDRLQK